MAVRIDRPSTPPPARYETITAPIRIEATYKRMVRVGEFAKVVIQFDPAPRGRGYSFHAAVSAEEVPERFLAGIEAGLDSARRRGPVAGFPVSDMTATLVGGAWHDLDSSELAFLNAAEMAFVELRQKGDFIVIEPAGERPPPQEDNVIPFPKRSG